jgi:succinylglutamate desuccinylase
LRDSEEGASEVAQVPAHPSRVVGRITGQRPGPTMIVMTGIHGNEGAGGLAAERLLVSLEGMEADLRGELVVLAGNLPALAERTRFIDEDLNREWTPLKMKALEAKSTSAHGAVEAGQRRELLAVFRELVAVARGQVYFLDLHTSSADGAPFLTVGDTLRNRCFAMQFPLPIILGLEEQVDGSLLEYLNNFGFVTMGVEAGQHDAPQSADRLTAVLRLALVHAGLLERSRLPGADELEIELQHDSRGIPPVLEVRHRHAITPESDFHMELGFKNFQPIAKGQLLAADRDGEIAALRNGRILLPLYQGKGDDGFFIAREISVFWLRLSALLRRLRLSVLVGFLPGVRRHPEHPEVLLVNTRVARAYPLEVFHLFGFRKLRQLGTALVVSRRRYDLTPPTERAKL